MDLSRLTDDDLISILVAQDLQDVNHLSRSEKEALVRAFIPDQADDLPVQHHSEISINNDTSVGVLAAEIETSNMEIDLTDELTSEKIENVTENPSTTKEEEEEVSEEQSHLISQFCEMTGKDPAYAKNILEATSWNVETAVSLHLEGISSGLSRTNSYQPVPHPPTFETPGMSTSEFPLPIPDHLVGDDWQRLMNLRRYISHEHLHHPMMEEDDDDETPNRVEYDEEGVRRPDPVRMQRLISRGFSGERSLGRAEDPTIEWLFPPARHLSSQESFDRVKEQGKEEKRWIVVNIQSHQEFPSHLLNRDTWTNESVESILRTTFIFWQRGSTTQDGRDFMRLYHLGEEQLPNITVVDPRTGASVFSWTGFIEPSELLVKLTDFADRNRLDKQLPNGTDSNSQSTRNSLQASDVKDDLPTKEDTSVSLKESLKDDVPPIQSSNLFFGSVPPIPEDSDGNSVKISMKLANGKSVTRKYNKFDPVKVLFAVALENDPINQTRPFDLISRFPALNLLPCFEKSIDECGLGGGNLLHRWL
mmetsp:Transcript_19550/g.21206  ORF Transcript_19550/g.21206 Transcript_19550/m.21206 type:complete len:534 (+) Transcript_19550:38-1639(+)|eukprot:CAMPEP_0173148644 /NCGR_PEP_ID=MMETSP1105-20130129/9845_1 /TAXON_ID=2985 /ORGANISM="Ochromonas sp., Strain BG-1" /LENGTH=533 /DNA_ID=CAMNT_0014063343 /DNA_START=32 /DNA_END=1633 /DNA_ORIENTATION=+